MAPAIEIKGLTKVFSTSDGDTRAVDSLDLTIEAGEVFGFLGPNGAGKTTTVQMLMSIIFPTAGTASLMGAPLDDANTRSMTGYLPELFQFHSFLRADEFLDFHARLYGMPSSQRKLRIDEVIDLVGLRENKKSRLRTYSKGMLQRIGIAQAIINRPKILFLDEPTSALDPMGRRDVRDLILNLRDGGTTIFINSHLLSEVEMTCGRVGILNKGRLAKVSELKALMKPGHAVEIKASSLEPKTMEAIRQMAERVDERDGYLVVTVKEESQLAELARIIIDSGASLTEFNPRRIALEDAFMHIIEESVTPTVPMAESLS
jgi:ABC-2 type transport system ATP-binding protein